MSYVTITDIDRDLTVTVLQDNEPAKIAGFGGWETVDRPKGQSFLNWKGQPLFSLSIPLLLDGWKSQTSIQRDFNIISVMGQPTRNTEQPPRIKVSGPALPLVGYQLGLLWVVDDIDWKESLKDSSGKLLRQPLGLTLLEYAEPDITLAQKQKKKTKRTSRIYVVKSGDTLLSIAKAKLQSAKRWREIAKLNNIRDPRAHKKLRKGKRLRLP